MKVPWMPKDNLAKKAGDVLNEYQDMVGKSVQPPIPVQDIIRRFLGLKLVYLDFEKKVGMEDVLGATYVNARVICLNENLLDFRYEGRMAFTCAHEIGHWKLHRDFVNSAARSESGGDVILCRAKDAKQPIEWQADYFASCLLLPAKEVGEAFRMAFGKNSMEIYNEKSTFKGSPIAFEPSLENWHFIASAVCDAGSFSNVSKQAMIIRLQELGLLVNMTQKRMAWDRTSI